MVNWWFGLVVWDSIWVPLSNNPFHFRVSQESKPPGPKPPITPPKFNIAPEKLWLEDFLLSYWVLVTFQGQTVKLREGSH